jgi:hypothetical protein
MSNFHFDLSLKFSQGEVHDFSGEVQEFSGEVQNDLRGDAHLPTPPLNIRLMVCIACFIGWRKFWTRELFTKDSFRRNRSESSTGL